MTGLIEDGEHCVLDWRGRLALEGALAETDIDPTRGRRWAATAVRSELRDLASAAGVRRRFPPHQLRRAHAVELAREGVAVNIIQRQLGHTDLGTTSTYLQGIDPIEIIDTVRTRRSPSIPMTAGLNL